MIPDTEAAVIRDILERQKLGIVKYGCTVAGNPLSLLEWHRHHLEELYDAAIYTKRIIQQMELEAQQ